MDQQQATRFFIHGTSPFTRLIVFSSLSLLLMASDSKFDYLSQVRQALMVAIQPLQIVANSPFKLYDNISNYFVSQQSLRQELGTLKKQTLVYGVQLQAFASLKSENENLRTLLDASKVSIHPANLAEIVYTGRDPFTQKVIVDRGATKNVVLGQVVVDGSGVLGQVTRVFSYTSEVTLVTDKELAIPIQVERNALRAIAFGHGRDNTLNLPYLPANVDIQKGDKLVTSGIDGVYPTGLAVAVVDSVKTNASSPFAQIVAKPVAGIQNHRQVLILSGELNELVAKDIKHTLDADANNESNKNKKNKTLRKHNGTL
jgi:rod shape-determining protein MreC